MAIPLCGWFAGSIYLVRARSTSGIVLEDRVCMIYVHVFNALFTRQFDLTSSNGFNVHKLAASNDRGRGVYALSGGYRAS